jgi:acyl carrier protein
LNLYGYTECCSNVTCYNTDDFDTSLLRVPIGKPIANTFVYVLDERLKPVPPGTIGELCVAGACLAQGYLNLDELTNQSFVRNPYAKPGAERLFRTGDLVRLGPDQKLELVGRLDNRVNIRGFRVDLEDIEATLMRYAGIERCAVVSFDSEDLNKLLVAFICMHQPITIGEIRSYARDQLPDYMVPGEFVFLDQMPLTINGKIDRKALPLPERIRPASNVGFVAPETDIEKAVAAIWSDVLNIESIGVNDNFFDLGGHSLIGSRIAARIREIIGITLPLRSIFDAPTIKSLAAAIVRLDFDQANLNTNLIHFLGDQTSGSPARNQEEANIGSFPDSATDSSVTITAGSLGVPLSYGQQQLWVHEQFSPGNSTFNLAAAYRIIGPLNYEALQDSIRSIIRRHSILRTYFIAGEEEPRQVIDETVSFDLPLLDLENLSELERTQQLDYWIRQEATKPFDLEHAPLMRARVLSLHSTESILLLTFHHLVFDGWSWGIFLSDLETQYRALSTGNETDLPSLPMQYADYAARQRRKTNRAAMAECLSYWKGRLQDAPEVLDIGLDKPRPRTQSFSGKHYRTMVDADLFGRLEEFAHKNSITLFTVLSAAFKLLLRHRSLNDDIVVGTPIANRDAINTELLIGYFINNLPLRTSLGGNPTFTELLERERDTILNAYIHPELVLAQLLVELGRPRQLQHFPIYQVMLIMLDSGWRTVRLHGLEVHAIDTDSYASQLDLTVFARPTAQGLSLTFEYNTDLFEPDTILKLAGDLIAILELAVTRPELNIDDFSRNLDERMLTASDLLRVAFIREARKCLLATNRKSIRLESSPSKRSTAGKTG